MADETNIYNFPTGEPSNRPKLGIQDTLEVRCDKCQSIVFEEVVILRRVSPLLSGQPKDIYIPINVFRCADCKTLNTNLIPDEIKTIIKT